MNLQETFAQKTTENGDLSFNKVGDDNLLNLLFFSEYFQKHLAEAHIGTSDRDKLFAMFMRDPRYGLGRRDLGRVLMNQAEVSIENIVLAGRFDDLLKGACSTTSRMTVALTFLKDQISKGNELAKKWMPRYASKNLATARYIAHLWGMNKQQYGHFIKANTTEQHLSRKQTELIQFEHVPSLAMLKYYNRFAKGEDTKDRFAQYLEDVKSGKKELHVSTSTVYDIYKNQDKIDPDLFFSKIEKIALNCIPIIDTSGSMRDCNDSYGKALAIGHYLAKYSTYAPNMVIPFSSKPHLIELGKERTETIQIKLRSWGSAILPAFKLDPMSGQYKNELRSMDTGDCSNTDFGAVMDLLKDLTDFPEYLVVLSDMEFDAGSNTSKTKLEKLWKEKGYTTKIVWWNLNSRNITAPEMDNMGNIFMSGYNPMLLKYLQAGFNGSRFLDILLEEYKKTITM